MNSIEKKVNKTFSDNPFWNLILNVLLPVFILKKGADFGDYVSPLSVLALALAIPVLVGAWDYIQAQKKNYVSILGVVNTGLTGGFAVFEVEGLWFAVKEGSLPFLIGIFVLISAKYKRNFITTFFLQPQVINLELIERKSRELGREAQVLRITQLGSIWFSISFFFSSVLNLVLGLMIFTSIDRSLPQAERAQLLNNQIAEMTWLGYIVIALPLTVGTGLLLWWLLKSLSRTLEITVDELLHKKS